MSNAKNIVKKNAKATLFDVYGVNAGEESPLTEYAVRVKMCLTISFVASNIARRSRMKKIYDKCNNGGVDICRMTKLYPSCTLRTESLTGIIVTIVELLDCAGAGETLSEEGIILAMRMSVARSIAAIYEVSASLDCPSSLEKSWEKVKSALSSGSGKWKEIAKVKESAGIVDLKPS